MNTEFKDFRYQSFLLQISFSKGMLNSFKNKEWIENLKKIIIYINNYYSFPTTYWIFKQREMITHFNTCSKKKKDDNIIKIAILNHILPYWNVINYNCFYFININCILDIFEISIESVNFSHSYNTIRSFLIRENNFINAIDILVHMKDNMNIC